MRYLLLVLLAACSSDPSSPSSSPDASSSSDAEVVTEAGTNEDAGRDATSASDASGDAPADVTNDAPTDAPAGDGGGCHAYTFGAAAVNITQVASLPSMTGGAIALGTYDAVEAKTTGAVTGTYRAIWVFETSSRMQILEQITLSGNPPTPVPRSLDWSTSLASLTRTQVCGGSQSFTNDYTARSDASGTYLDVRSGGLLFTFKKR